MAISPLALARLRANRNSVSSLKDRTFNSRLRNDYNTEELAFCATGGDTFKAIVQMSTYNYSIESRILDYQKVSIPFSVHAAIGDVLYWPRMQKNYLIFADRDTEKNYFLCYMTAADYEITWYDQYGIKHTQVASFLQTAKETIKTTGDLYDYLDASMQLLLKQTAATDDLTYYNKIWINDKNWQIVGKSTSTFPGMVAIYLKEVPLNPATDTKDGLPEGAKVVTTEITTSYDNLTEVAKDSSTILNLSTVVNGNIVSDTYTITTENCVFDKASYKLSFPTLGAATITIASSKSSLKKVLHLNVVATKTATVSYIIEGNEKATNFLTYSYSAYKLTDGAKSPVAVAWTLADTKLAKIESTKDNTCAIHMGDDVGTITLTASLDGKEIGKKEIVIDSIY